MSLEDPFFVVKDEVEQAVSSVRKLYERWQELYSSSSVTENEEYEWATNELKNSVRGIEWDLEDLDDTIDIVEQNPLKFKITANEMNERKGFIIQTRQTIKEIKDTINSQQAKSKIESNNRTALLNSKSHASNKYEKLDDELTRDNQTFISEQRRDHKMEMEEQDRNLERVGRSVGVLKHLGTEIGRELDDQVLLMDDLGENMDQTDSQLRKVTKKVERVLDSMSDGKQWAAIVHYCMDGKANGRRNNRVKTRDGFRLMNIGGGTMGEVGKNQADLLQGNQGNLPELSEEGSEILDHKRRVFLEVVLKDIQNCIPLKTCRRRLVRLGIVVYMGVGEGEGEGRNIHGSAKERKYKVCFMGGDALDLMVTRGHVESRDHAIQICQQWLDEGVIKSVVGNTVFKSKHHYYQFSTLSHTELAALNLRQRMEGVDKLNNLVPSDSTANETVLSNTRGPLPDDVYQEIAFDMMLSLPVMQKVVISKKICREVFEGKTICSWMIEKKYASNLTNAMTLCSHLLVEGILASTTASQTFRANWPIYIYWRLGRYEHAYIWCPGHGPNHVVLYSFSLKSVPRSQGANLEKWTGSDAVLCLLWSGIAQSIEDAIAIGRTMIKTEMIQPLDLSREFKNDPTLYTFSPHIIKQLNLSLMALQPVEKTLSSFRKLQKISQMEVDRVKLHAFTPHHVFAPGSTGRDDTPLSNRASMKSLLKKFQRTDHPSESLTPREGPPALPRSTSLNYMCSEAYPDIYPYSIPKPQSPLSRTGVPLECRPPPAIMARRRSRVRDTVKELKLYGEDMYNYYVGGEERGDECECGMEVPKYEGGGCVRMKHYSIVQSNGSALRATQSLDALEAPSISMSSVNQIEDTPPTEIFEDHSLASNFHKRVHIVLSQVREKLLADAASWVNDLNSPDERSDRTPSPSPLESVETGTAFHSCPNVEPPLSGSGQYIIESGWGGARARCNKRPRPLFLQDRLCTAVLHPPCPLTLGPLHTTVESTNHKGPRGMIELEAASDEYSRNNPAVYSAIEAILTEGDSVPLDTIEACISRMRKGFFALVYPRKERNSMLYHSDQVEAKQPLWQMLVLDKSNRIIYRRYWQGLCALRNMRIDDLIECRPAGVNMELWTGTSWLLLPECVADRTIRIFRQGRAHKPFTATFRSKNECDAFTRGWQWLKKACNNNRDLNIIHLKDTWIQNSQCDLDDLMALPLVNEMVRKVMKLTKETLAEFDKEIESIKTLPNPLGKLLPGWVKIYDELRGLDQWVHGSLVTYSQAIATGACRGGLGSHPISTQLPRTLPSRPAVTQVPPVRWISFDTFLSIFLRVTSPPIVTRIVRELHSRDVTLRLVTGRAFKSAKGGMSSSAFKVWLRDIQGEKVSPSNAVAIAIRLGVTVGSDQRFTLGSGDMHRFLTSGYNSIVDPCYLTLYQDMSYPLYNYFISTSHNTYLTGDQLRSNSSVEAYIRALLRGCRCLELDTWEGEASVPVITHGHTLTSKIPFKQVIQAIAKYAFETSPYPVVLSFENHCGIQAQKTMADEMRACFGDAMLTLELNGVPDGDIPSPERLKGMILIKAKATLSRSYNDTDHDRWDDKSSINREEEWAEGANSTFDPDLADMTMTEDRAQSGIRSSPLTPVEMLCLSDNEGSLVVSGRSDPETPGMVHSALRKTLSFGDAQTARPIKKSLSTPQPSTQTGELRHSFKRYLRTPFNRDSTSRHDSIGSDPSRKGNKRFDLMHNSSMEASPLAELAIYTKAAPFCGQIAGMCDKVPIISHLLVAPHANPSPPIKASREMCSIGELKARKVCSVNEGKDLMEYCKSHLVRVYPAAKRINSSNYDPVPFWNCGVQMVALNYQKNDHAMQLNEAKFLMNGGCGYVLKPPYLRNVTQEGSSDHPQLFTLSSVCMEWSPFFHGIGPVWLEVEVNGVEEDNNSRILFSTQYLSAEHVMWADEMVFLVTKVKSAIFTFRILSRIPTGMKLVAYNCIPVETVRGGVRNVPLLDLQGVPTIPSAALLLHIT
eukprot:Ihof_evm4s90 gene=Ihof_evmTU4s90